MQRKRTKRSRIRAAKPTAGHGHKKKNRGAGNRGGRGKAGGGKRGDSRITRLLKGKTRKEYLGKHGFTSHKDDETIVNIADLQHRLLTLESEGKINLKGGIYEIDLGKLGYDKLLSKGDVLHKMKITVKKASKNAIKKIESAGGSVEIIK